MSTYESGDFDLVVEEPVSLAGLRPLARNMALVKRDHPDVWVRIVAYTSGSTAKTTASELRSGKRTVPPGNWEFRSGQIEDGRYAVWAKFLGE